MPSKLTKNTFEGGLNLDLDQTKLAPNQYTNATDVGLSSYISIDEISNNNALQVRPIDGSVLEVVIPAGTISKDARVLAAIPSRYDEAGTLVDNCITIITIDDAGILKIFAYVPTGAGVLYSLYVSTADAAYKAANPVVDYDVFKDENYDVIYFNDGYNEQRKLVCKIPTGYVANFLSDSDLSRQRETAAVDISLTSIGTSGALLAGAYQYTSRLYDEDTGKFTKWSSLTDPVYTFNTPATTQRSDGGIGVLTNNNINLSIAVKGGQEARYSHVQLGVVENTGSVKSNTLSILPLTALTAATITFNHQSSDYIEERPVDEVVVPKAPIKTAGTLAIKNNRLFDGNIEYHDLSYDNGDPTVKGSVLVTASATRDDGFADNKFASATRGHFRGEVYRYYISYFDKYGNYSNPKVLDMLGDGGTTSGITNNKISGATDMKFPTQADHTDYALLNATDSAQSLGLNVTIDNHPTWAKGFEILRAKRKKNILFQTPVVPMSKVDGVKATGNYPTTAEEDSGTKTYTDAQPMNPLGTYVPTNLFRVYNRDLSTFGNGNGDVNYKQNASPDYYMVFPSQNIYDTNDAFSRWELNKGNLNITDAAALRLTYDTHDATGTYSEGDWLGTSVSGTFYATSTGAYYYNAGAGAKASAGDLGDDITIKKSFHFDNYDNGQVDGTNYIFEFDNLITEGIPWGTKAQAPRSAIVQVQQGGGSSDLISDATVLGFAYSGGSIPAAILTDYNTGGSHEQSNFFVFEHASYLSTSPVKAVYIANATLGLGDNRYGNDQSLFEVIATGAKHTFSTAELTTVAAGTTLPIPLEVWGGDCYTALHNFKISDTSYSITNPSLAEAVSLTVAKWERAFKDSGGIDSLRLPVPLQNCSQIVSVVLESEVNAEVLENLHADYTSGATTLKKWVETSEATARLYPRYKYNPNYSNENDYRVYVPYKEPDFSVVNVPHRVHYSNIHIFGNTESGFETYNVLDFYDLSGDLGGITKLINCRDNLYSINTDGMVYIPVGERMLEAADSSIIQVRSGEVIGQPSIISNSNGSSLMKSITKLPDGFVGVDEKRGAIFKFITGGGLSLISDNGVRRETQDSLNLSVPASKYTTVYHPVHDVVLFINRTTGTTLMYNNKMNLWESYITSDIVAADARVILLDGCVADFGGNLGLGLIGLKGDGISNFTMELHQMFSYNAKNIFGYPLSPSITFSVNENPEVVKTYDNLLVYSSGDLSANIVPSLANGASISITGASSATKREGIYRMQILRDSLGARARGNLALISLNFGENRSFVSQVLTKYRHSNRIF